MFISRILLSAEIYTVLLTISYLVSAKAWKLLAVVSCQNFTKFFKLAIWVVEILKDLFFEIVLDHSFGK